MFLTDKCQAQAIKMMYCSTVTQTKSRANLTTQHKTTNNDDTPTIINRLYILYKVYSHSFNDTRIVSAYFVRSKQFNYVLCVTILT